MPRMRAIFIRIRSDFSSRPDQAQYKLYTKGQCLFNFHITWKTNITFILVCFYPGFLTDNYFRQRNFRSFCFLLLSMISIAFVHNTSTRSNINNWKTIMSKTMHEFSRKIRKLGQNSGFYCTFKNSLGIISHVVFTLVKYKYRRLSFKTIPRRVASVNKKDPWCCKDGLKTN
jgi:hypothetical protein